jgi:hypothetical protein
MRQLASSGGVVAEGIFPGHRGGILILQGDHDAEMIGNDPAVVSGVLSYEVKKWWVAEGAFCETGIRRD